MINYLYTTEQQYSTDILVARNTTDTLTNKTLTTPTINGPTITATGQTPVIHSFILPSPHGIYFEGATTDANQILLYCVDPTADRTILLPNVDGTIVTTGNLSNITSVGTLTSLTVTGNLTVDSNTLFVDSTNDRVGIGNTSPSATLDVYTGSGSFPSLRINNLGTGPSLVVQDETSPDTTPFIINESGDVGIGVLSPTAKLEVLSTNTTGIKITHTGSGNSFLVEDSASTDSTPFVIDNEGKVGIGTTSPQATLDIQHTGASTAMRITNTGLGNSFVVEDSTTTDSTPFVIDSSGNVGIGGSASAMSLVSVYGTLRSSPTLANDGVSLVGRAGGTGFYSATLTPTTLTASRTVTLPDATGTVITTGNLSDFTVTAGTTTTGATGVGYMGMPQNVTTTGAYGIVAADAGKHIYSTATRTVTIPANSNVAMPIGTTITFVAGSGATVTIAITTDTLLLAGPGTTGSRTLAPFGIATAVKIASTTWIISGNGLT